MLRLSDDLQEEVIELDGYLGRRLCKVADGGWADVVRWTSQEAAQRAARILETRACFQELMRIEEPGSGRILLLEPMKAYPGGSETAGPAAGPGGAGA